MLGAHTGRDYLDNHNLDTNVSFMRALAYHALLRQQSWPPFKNYVM